MLCDRIAVMSAAPGVVKSVIPVDVRRPRTIKSMSDPDFVRCVEKIWELLRYEVDKAMKENHPSRVERPPEERARKSFLGWWG